MNTSPSRVLTFVLLAAAIGIGALVARRTLHDWTAERLARRYREAIAARPEAEAADLVRRLAGDGNHWLDLIVAALADDRPGVARAAETAIEEQIESWSLLPTDQCSRQVASLARLLAQQTGSLPAERRSFSSKLAQRLIVWPTDGSDIDVAQLIADCQTVLLLPAVEPTEIRVAQVRRGGRVAESTTPPTEPALPLPAAAPLHELPAPPAVNAQPPPEPRPFAVPEAALIRQAR